MQVHPPTYAIAAKCMTRSGRGLALRSTVFTSSEFPRSTRRNLNFDGGCSEDNCARAPMLPRDMLSTMVTAWPCSRSSRAACDAMNPAPPVTRMWNLPASTTICEPEAGGCRYRYTFRYQMKHEARSAAHRNLRGSMHMITDILSTPQIPLARPWLQKCEGIKCDEQDDDKVVARRTQSNGQHT